MKRVEFSLHVPARIGRAPIVYPPKASGPLILRSASVAFIEASAETAASATASLLP